MPYRAELRRPDLKGVFRCTLCQKVFCHSSSLSRHRMQAHFKSYTCTLCNNEITSNETLRAHMFRKHQISRMFMCRCCNWAFPDKTSLHIHVQAMTSTNQPGNVNIIAKSASGPGQLGSPGAAEEYMDHDGPINMSAKGLIIQSDGDQPTTPVSSAPPMQLPPMPNPFAPASGLFPMIGGMPGLPNAELLMRLREQAMRSAGLLNPTMAGGLFGGFPSPLQQTLANLAAANANSNPATTKMDTDGDGNNNVDKSESPTGSAGQYGRGESSSEDEGVVVKEEHIDSHVFVDDTSAAEPSSGSSSLHSPHPNSPQAQASEISPLNSLMYQKKLSTALRGKPSDSSAFVATSHAQCDTTGALNLVTTSPAISHGSGPMESPPDSGFAETSSARGSCSTPPAKSSCLDCPLMRTQLDNAERRNRVQASRMAQLEMGQLRLQQSVEELGEATKRKDAENTVLRAQCHRLESRLLSLQDQMLSFLEKHPQSDAVVRDFVQRSLEGMQS